MFQLICTLITLVCSIFILIGLIKNHKIIEALQKENMEFRNRIKQLELDLRWLEVDLRRKNNE